MSLFRKSVVKNYLNEEELKVNGYEVLKGKRLKEFKLLIKDTQVSDISVAQSTANLGIFNFRVFLNLGMLLTESEKAKTLRSVILDIVLDTINKRTGGSTKYIKLFLKNMFFRFNQISSGISLSDRRR